MTISLKKYTDYFLSIGAEDVPHTNKSYLAHAIGVYNDLKRWGAAEDLCVAGLFHSIYGTEFFQGFKLPLDRRPELQELIGVPAERMAYLNCAMDRGTFDRSVFLTAGPYPFLDRLTGETTEMDETTFTELCTLHVCDWLEQVERSQNWNYRRPAYRQMALRLGGIAESSYRTVFARAPGGVTTNA